MEDAINRSITEKELSEGARKKCDEVQALAKKHGVTASLLDIVNEALEQLPVSKLVPAEVQFRALRDTPQFRKKLAKTYNALQAGRKPKPKVKSDDATASNNAT